ncbi:MAG: replicative DNA helicase [Ignavibacteriales bacterium]
MNARPSIVWSEEAERATLGACLIEREAIIKSSEILKPTMFYHPQHVTIYEAMLALVNADEPVDFQTVHSALAKKDGKDDAWLNYLMELANFVPTAAHVEAYAREVREQYIRREMLSASTKIAELAGAPDLQQALSQAEQAVFAISQQSLQPLRYFGEVVSERWGEINQARDNPHALGTMTGFKRLDEALGGLQVADLVVLAARPSMGKSALGAQIALNVARAGKPAIIFSLEMGKKLLADRAICAEGHLDSQALRARVLSGHEWDVGTSAASRLMAFPLWVDDTASITTLEMRAKARRLKAEKGDLGLVVVDYLQLIGDRPEGGWSKNDHIGRITNRVKAMARELDCPVLLLSQLNRESEKNPEKIPQLSNLRDSGEIEASADVVMFIHRKDYYDPKDEPGVATVIVAKNRNGPTGRVDFWFERRFMEFRPLEKRRCDDGPRQERERGTYLDD